MRCASSTTSASRQRLGCEPSPNRRGTARWSPSSNSARGFHPSKERKGWLALARISLPDRSLSLNVFFTPLETTLVIVPLVSLKSSSKVQTGMLRSPSLWSWPCLLYTSDAADDLLCVDLG